MMGAYGVDVLAPGVSLRRIWVLWQRLPPSTRARAAVEESWSQESYLLANAVDYLAHLDYVTTSVNSKQHIDMPKPTERPGDKTRDKTQTGTAPAGQGWARSLLRKLGGGQVTPGGR
jgi:hypothetical protein